MDSLICVIAAGFLVLQTWVHFGLLFLRGGTLNIHRYSPPLRRIIVKYNISLHGNADLFTVMCETRPFLWSNREMKRKNRWRTALKGSFDTKRSDFQILFSDVPWLVKTSRGSEKPRSLNTTWSSLRKTRFSSHIVCLSLLAECH